MTERMSDERKEKIEKRLSDIKAQAKANPFKTSPLSFELLAFIDEYEAALRSERATVERLTKVAEQAVDEFYIVVVTEDVYKSGLYDFRHTHIGETWIVAGGFRVAKVENAPELAAYLREKENT